MKFKYEKPKNGYPEWNNNPQITSLNMNKPHNDFVSYETKKEAIEVILDMADYKQNGTLNHLFVFGCLAKRYKNEILESMPEVDLVVGVDEYANLEKILTDLIEYKM